MATTIQVSQELKDRLSFRKASEKDSYEEVIWDLLEDQLSLKDSVLDKISNGIKDFEDGNFFTMDEVFGERE